MTGHKQTKLLGIHALSECCLCVLYACMCMGVVVWVWVGESAWKYCLWYAHEVVGCARDEDVVCYDEIKYLQGTIERHTPHEATLTIEGLFMNCLGEIIRAHRTICRQIAKPSVCTSTRTEHIKYRW